MVVESGAFPGVDAVFDNVRLGIDTEIDASLVDQSGLFLGILQGLTLDAEIILKGTQNNVAELGFYGAQSINGTGTILLSHSNALEGGVVRNELSFIGEVDGREILTIGEHLTIRGEGKFYALDDDDRIDLKGLLRAEGGRLEIQRFDALDGTLGASADGVLDVEGDLDMLNQGRLEIEVGQNEIGKIEVAGSLDQAGTLALDVADGFVANLGDTFEFATATNGFSGDFQDFEGFDLPGSLAFVLDETENALSLRVATDAEADAEGFIAGLSSNEPDDSIF